MQMLLSLISSQLIQVIKSAASNLLILKMMQLQNKEGTDLSLYFSSLILR